MVALALGLVLRAVASFAPLHGFWGLDTLKSWPWPLALAVVAFGAIGFLPPVARAVERVMDAVGSFRERSGPVLDAVMAVGLGVALFHLRDPLGFTGDFLTRVSQLKLEAPTPEVFPQAALLDRWINIELPRILMKTRRMEAIPALQAVGAVMGAGFVFAVLAFLRSAGASRGPLVAAAAAVLGGGYMLHFAGYEKFGPLLFGIALASYGAARLARDGRGAWALGLGVTVGLLAHRSGFALVPAAALILVQAWRRATDARARLHLAAVGATMLATALGLLPRAWRLLLTVDRMQNLPGAAGGRPVGAHGLADAALRAGDALNLLFLIAPLWLAGLAAAWTVRDTGPPPRAALGFSLVPAATLALGAELVLLVVVRGAQGVSRDWDMHLAPGLVVMLISAALLITVWSRRGAGGALAPTFTTALASAVALWGVHLSEPVAIARVGELLADRGAWSDPAWARAHDFLGMRALDQRRPEVAIREFQAAITAAPNPRFFVGLGIAYRMLGHPGEARARFVQAHRLNPGLSDAWVGFALLAMDEGDFPRAAACCESALAISPYRSDAKSIRASALGEMARGTERANPSR